MARVEQNPHNSIPLWPVFPQVHHQSILREGEEGMKYVVHDGYIEEQSTDSTPVQSPARATRQSAQARDRQRGLPVRSEQSQLRCENNRAVSENLNEMPHQWTEPTRAASSVDESAQVGSQEVIAKLKYFEELLTGFQNNLEMLTKALVLPEVRQEQGWQQDEARDVPADGKSEGFHMACPSYLTSSPHPPCSGSPNRAHGGGGRSSACNCPCMGKLNIARSLGVLRSRMDHLQRRVRKVETEMITPKDLNRRDNQIWRTVSALSAAQLETQRQLWDCDRLMESGW
jgi:hypothetical protein